MDWSRRNSVMSKVPKKEWTEKEILFDKYVNWSESRMQVRRIEGRMGIHNMTKELGKEEMERMWERIK